MQSPAERKAAAESLKELQRVTEGKKAWACDASSQEVVGSMGWRV